ncbi:MAG: M16 family metallopeptidase [Bacteroidota bacterium]
MKTNFERRVLPNGLTLLLRRDDQTRMGCLNLMVRVGSRDESPDQTGFAHLFEHLMFSGSKHVPSYDQVAQSMGAENNAFTSNDLTNYYLTFPAPQLEVALWLESDRMGFPIIDQKALDTQKQVVVEEFKERYLNQPYGDAWLELRDLAYQVHPYRWATIGKEISHIEQATLEQVQAFRRRFYAPDQMILGINGPYDLPQVEEWVTHWFGELEQSGVNRPSYAVEPQPTGIRRREKRGAYPAPALYMAFPMPGRTSEDYHACDLITDVLSRGQSSRLFRGLVMDRPMFSDLNAYVTGDMDPGLLVVSGHCAQGVSIDDAENAVWEELYKIANHGPSQDELNKSLNQIEASLVMGRTNGLNVAMNLCYFEYLSQAEDLDGEIEAYRKVTPDRVRALAALLLKPERASILRYLPNEQDDHG